ncbi:NAD(P)-binding protein [Penicillium brevicompactum]|uniref:NAD(P)-binding protein n=1 Tax=Penicillium brevicompactum TaxID=5074 RepID=A0A9W9QH57_PENBR|nr:NAD(P)-binding protein [Penicillium brevicompactum]
MPRILVTGGSGFLGGMIVDTLLERGHSVLATVRSADKARSMKSQRPQVPPGKLDFVIVEDIAKLDAFNQAVVCDPPLDIIIHTASPFHYSITDSYAPTVKRVVITSSFVAMYNSDKAAGSKYSESDWNPVTWETAEDAANATGQSGYRTSKALAKKEAWAFMEREEPGFSLAVLNPSLILGPVSSLSLGSLEDINTSNERIRDFMTGKLRDRCPPTGSPFWVDVRDVAMAHVAAAEKPEAAGKRFFLTAGNLCNREIVEIIYESFPDLRENLPQGEESLKDGSYPPGGPTHGYDNGQSIEYLGLNYRSLKVSVVDALKSLQMVQKVKFC